MRGSPDCSFPSDRERPRPISQNLLPQDASVTQARWKVGAGRVGGRRAVRPTASTGHSGTRRRPEPSTVRRHEPTTALDDRPDPVHLVSRRGHAAGVGWISGTAVEDAAARKADSSSKSSMEIKTPLAVPPAPMKIGSASRPPSWRRESNCGNIDPASATVTISMGLMIGSHGSSR
jgi:hypothetical protein